MVVGRSTEEIFGDLGGFWRRLAGDSHLRWIGPEKGALHLGLAAVVNAVWDLYAKVRGLPLWRLLVEMSPAEVIALVDFRYLSDVLDPGRARELLEERRRELPVRLARLEEFGIPAYTTSAGWIGYDDDRLRQRCRDAVAAGWDRLKIKIGRDLDRDLRRVRLVRDEIGLDRQLMLDANQVWEVEEALAWMSHLSQFRPLWIEEPTSPDDVLGHARIAAEIAPVLVAAGEHVHNRVMFKQFLQARAMGVCQLDACRLGGVNEAIAVMLLAAHFAVPVCPHAGGVGLCEYVQHLAAFDQAVVTPIPEAAMVEFVDHLHEHFTDPVRVRPGRYLLPRQPGFSAQLRPESLARFAYPGGEQWRRIA
jgi:L-fuconate dehydratase